MLHTPDFEAAKAWAGNLAKTATLAVVFAQLYTPDDRDKSKGLHSFAVPIRNPKTMETYPGLPPPPPIYVVWKVASDAAAAPLVAAAGCLWRWRWPLHSPGQNPLHF